ncbi:DUF4142 domain-containing protein [Mucilaginibacter panaciglaebae]|uniref:DUF4142 domain-containing protein n=2 Tax=Mucilaginibacter panaciglaebae TaxID=502331 RepID=A0ABP7WES7_9SPHI
MVDESAVSFVKQGLEVSQTEINASKMAQTTSKNARVINFAQMMIADHAGVNDDLQKIAIANKIAASDSIGAAHQAAITSMANNSGVKFDQAYIQLMINGHQEAIKIFNVAKSDRNEDVQRFARKTLPVLMMHLDSANAIAASLK